MTNCTGTLDNMVDFVKKYKFSGFICGKKKKRERPSRHLPVQSRCTTYVHEAVYIGAYCSHFAPNCLCK